MFTISAGALSEDQDELVFKAIQTYSDGEQVRWIEVPVRMRARRAGRSFVTYSGTLYDP